MPESTTQGTGNIDAAAGMLNGDAEKPRRLPAATSIVTAARKYLPLAREGDALWDRYGEAASALMVLEAEAKRGPRGDQEAWSELHDTIVEAVKDEGDLCIVKAGGSFFVVDPGEKTTSVERIEARRFYDLDAMPPAPPTLEEAGRAFIETETRFNELHGAIDATWAAGAEVTPAHQAKADASTDDSSVAGRALLPLILGPDGTGRAAIVDGHLLVVHGNQVKTDRPHVYRFEPEYVRMIRMENVTDTRTPVTAIEENRPMSPQLADATPEDPPMVEKPFRSLIPHSLQRNRFAFVATSGTCDISREVRRDIDLQAVVADLIREHGEDGADDLAVWRSDCTGNAARLLAAIRFRPGKPPAVTVFDQGDHPGNDSA